MSKTDHYFHFLSHIVWPESFFAVCIFMYYFLCNIVKKMRSIPLGNGKHFFAFCRYPFHINIYKYFCFVVHWIDSIYLFIFDPKKYTKNFNFLFHTLNQTFYLSMKNKKKNSNYRMIWLLWFSNWIKYSFYYYNMDLWTLHKKVSYYYY